MLSAKPTAITVLAHFALSAGTISTSQFDKQCFITITGCEQSPIATSWLAVIVVLPAT